MAWCGTQISSLSRRFAAQSAEATSPSVWRLELFILNCIVDCLYPLLSGVQAQGAGRTYLRRTDGIRQWAAVITVSNTNSLL